MSQNNDQPQSEQKFRESHDTNHKAAFKHLPMVEDLIESQLPADFPSKLHDVRLEPAWTNFTSDTLKQTYADVVWKIVFLEFEMFIFIVIEHQSTIDKYYI